ncbi:hypothetical protein [Culturomica massiliensis]|uniref:hypothetical protein n=1 Tax=Culturomica massiliensis TaxID=1841857 RepID=UPI003AF0FED5
MKRKVISIQTLLNFSLKYGKVHIDPIDEVHEGNGIKFKRFFFYHNYEYYYVNVSPLLGLISTMDIVSQARDWLIIQFDNKSFYLCSENELTNFENA